MRMRRAHRTRQVSAPFDVPYGDGYLGVRHDAGTLLTVLALDPGPAGPVCLDRPWAQTAPGTGLPWDLLAQWMNGAETAAVDLTVVTHGSACPDTGPAGAAYRTLVGPLSVAAHRAVHLAIGFSPLAHPALVARYGEGTAAALRACLSATRRLADRLAGAGLTAAPLSAAALTRLTDQLSIGVDRSVSCAVHPADPAALPAALEAGWRAGTAVTTALRRRTGAAGPELTALARIDRPVAPMPPDWLPLTGEDGAAPITAPGSAASHAGPGPLPAGTLAALHGAVLPIGGAGVIVGADAAGSPVGLRLAGTGAGSAEISGDGLLARRLVVRLAALGISVAVFTDRPERWAALIDAVADRRLLHPAADGAAQVLVDDRPDARLGPLDGHTVLRIRPAGEAAEPGPGGVSVRQDREDPGYAVLTGAGRDVRVRLVATPDEDALTDPARPGAVPAGVSAR